MLNGPGNIRVVWSASCCDQNFICPNCFAFSLRIYKFNLVWSHEFCQFVEVGHLFVVQNFSVSVVQGLNVIGDFFRSYSPIMWLVPNCPSSGFEILHWLSEKTGVMEQFFRDASDIHTCSCFRKNMYLLNPIWYLEGKAWQNQPGLP